jgi:hypothetical protein
MPYLILALQSVSELKAKLKKHQTGNIPTSVTLKRVRVTIVAKEKQ